MSCWTCFAFRSFVSALVSQDEDRPVIYWLFWLLEMAAEYWKFFFFFKPGEVDGNNEGKEQLPATASFFFFKACSHIEKSVCNIVVIGRTCFRRVSTTLWCPGTTCMSFPARSSRFVRCCCCCCSLAASLYSVSDFQIETCIFFFCRQQLYFQANQGCGSRRFGVSEKLQFMMKCIKC